MNECNHVDGTCDNKCKQGYKQPMCTEGAYIIFNSYVSFLMKKTHLFLQTQHTFKESRLS